MNQVNLVGRLTKNPELRYLGERPYTSFFLAINRTYRNNQGEVEADFIQCAAWGKLAERVVQFCGKGSLVGVDGKVHCRSYVNRENKKVFSTEIIAHDVRFYSLKDPQAASHINDSTSQLDPNVFILPT